MSAPIHHAAAGVAITAAIVAVACTGDPTTAPRSAQPAPRVSALITTPTPHTIQVCKTGPAGRYHFTVGTPTGNVHPSDVFVSSFDLIVPANATNPVCTTIFTRTEADNSAGDAIASVLVTEAAAAGTTLASITPLAIVDPLLPLAVPDVPNRRIDLSVNAFHSTGSIFNNVPAGPNCTFTQGFYKNKGSNLLPSGNFFSSGMTYLQILDTPPKGGNGYLILAHQYIAATLNVQGGAVPTSAVSAAITTATSFFNGTLAQTNDQLVALANTLDAFNSGITGPGECSG